MCLQSAGVSLPSLTGVRYELVDSLRLAVGGGVSRIGRQSYCSSLAGVPAMTARGENAVEREDQGGGVMRDDRVRDGVTSGCGRFEKGER